MKQYKMIALIISAMMLFSATGCMNNTIDDNIESSSDTSSGEYRHLKTSDTVGTLVSHSAFDDFGRFLLPLEKSYDENMSLSDVGSLMPYHNEMDTGAVVETFNYMIDEVADGQQIFYDIYTEKEKVADPSKENTGLFFFRGNLNSLFAVICAGGGFAYVGSAHESFPHAIELAKKGYNAFAVQYRTGGGQVAYEDLAAALSFIFKNAEILQVNTDCYSVWGGSAGARMAATIGSYGVAAFGGDDIPKPGTVVMQYTGHSDYNQNGEPPTFVVIGENDSIASHITMEHRIENLRAIGIPVEYHLYSNLGHGFGLGIGTTAEGWLDLAVAFWEEQFRSYNTSSIE